MQVSKPAGESPQTPRKQSRPTRARGKAGYRRLEAVLEAANIVIQRVEGENDIGRDAFVDIVDGTDVMGGVVCIQIKSGRASYFHNGTWMIPGKPADFTLWRESTVPFFGVVHDDETDALRWVDLSEAAMLALDKVLSPVTPGPFGRLSVPVPADNLLDRDFSSFLEAAEEALKRRSGKPVAALLAEDAAKVQSGIIDTFAMGRHDPTAFLLLAALLHRLPKANRRHAISTLAMTTSHPDIPWTEHNWIPERVSRVVRERVSWTEQDLATLLAEIDEDGAQRGTFGQSVFHVLTLDRGIKPKLLSAALNRALPDHSRFWSTAFALYLSGEDAVAVLENMLRADESLYSEEGLFPPSHGLSGVRHFDQLVEHVREYGSVSIF